MMFWGEGLNKIGTEIFIDDFICNYSQIADRERELCVADSTAILHIVSVLGRCVNVL